VADVECVLTERFSGDPADADQEARLHDADQPIGKNATGTDLAPGGPAVGQRLAREVRMGGHGVPQDHPPLGAEFFEHAVDDRAGGLPPGSRPAAGSAIWITPANQIEFAGEGNARPAHALIPRGLTDSDDVSRDSLIEVLAEIREPNGGCVR